MNRIDKLLLKMKGEIGAVAIRTMANCDKVIAGMKRLDGGAFPIMSEYEKQQAYVDSSLERCRRCGNPVVYLQPVGLGTLCPECERYFRDLDGDLIWFVDMIERQPNVEGGRKK